MFTEFMNKQMRRMGAEMHTAPQLPSEISPALGIFS